MTPFNVIYSLVEHVVAVPISRLVGRVDNYGLIKKIVPLRLKSYFRGKKW